MHALAAIPLLSEGWLCSVCSSQPSICWKVALGLRCGLSSSDHHLVTTLGNSRLRTVWGLKHTLLGCGRGIGFKAMRRFFFFHSLSLFLSFPPFHLCGIFLYLQPYLPPRQLVALLFNTINCLPVSVLKVTLVQQIISVFTYMFFFQSPRSFQSVLVLLTE